MDNDTVIKTANALLKRACDAGPLPGLLGLLAAAGRFAERRGIDRATLHTLLDAAYSISADVGVDDPPAPTFSVRRLRRRARAVPA